MKALEDKKKQPKKWKMFISVTPFTSVSGVEPSVQLALLDIGIVFKAPVIYQ
jgi:hypothetical protein